MKKGLCLQRILVLIQTKKILSFFTVFLGELSKYETTKYKALFPYDAKDVFGHLSIKEDEEIVEVKPDKGGWTVVKNAKAEEGAVPTNCLGNQLAILFMV